MSPDEAIRVAAKLAIDAGDLSRARALLDLLDVDRRTAPVAILAPRKSSRYRVNQCARSAVTLYYDGCVSGEDESTRAGCLEVVAEREREPASRRAAKAAPNVVTLPLREKGHVMSRELAALRAARAAIDLSSELVTDGVENRHRTQVETERVTLRQVGVYHRLRRSPLVGEPERQREVLEGEGRAARGAENVGLAKPA